MAGHRVLMVAPQPFYEDRGTPIAVRQVLEALVELAYQVDVVTYPIGSALELPSIRVFRASNPFGIRRVPIGFSLRKVLLDGSLIPVLHQRLRRRRYLCVHAVEEAAFPAVALGRRYGVPVIYDMQSSLPEQMAARLPFRSRPAQALLRACERWLLASADFVVSSTGLEERVGTLAPQARVRQWRYASPILHVRSEDVSTVRVSLGIPSDAPVVLYSGTFEPYQGLRDLVAAIPNVLAQVPGAVFVLVGAEGADAAAIARQARGCVPPEALRIVERQPRARVPAFLAMADVLVSPRAYGGNVPLKIYDYLAAGKPIVATALPAHRGVLDGTRAALVDPSPDSFAGAIARLLKEPAQAARLGAAARSYAEAHLGWMNFVESVSELYHEVRANGRRYAWTGR